MNQPVRKGARRTADISADLLAALSRGDVASATLTEGLALDQHQLVQSVFPTLSGAGLTAVQACCELGILKRMAGIASVLWRELGEDALLQCAGHRSDTVRGWACFMVGERADIALAARLNAIRALADDDHFGVREWAWMALRPHLAGDLDAALALLEPWTADASANVRRYASEVLRPRGVWCAHIGALKQDPAPGLRLLAPLRADDSVYVQDSVANWLNDAAKDHPDWVRSICSSWLQGEPAAATVRICKRAQRSLA